MDLRPGDPLPVGGILPRWLGQVLQLPLQAAQALLQCHQPLRKGMQGFCQILGMAADSE